MARKKKPAPPPSLRTALTGIQREGQRLASRLERDLRRLVRRTQADLSSDARTLRRQVVTRVAKVSRDLDGRTSAARRGIERRLAALEGAVRSRLHIAGSEDVASVKAQLAALTHRLERLEARLGTASADLHD